MSALFPVLALTFSVRHLVAMAAAINLVRIAVGIVSISLWSTVPDAGRFVRFP
jgi:hypothetical protein